MGKRLKWVDIAKGMGILLVIVGHSFNQRIIRGPIFTFHMPLFFILSGITFRMSGDGKAFARRTRKRLGRLVFPAIALYFVRSFVAAALSRDSINPCDMMRVVLYSSGVAFGPEGARIPAIGAVWFLMALFVTELLTDGAHLLVRGAGEKRADTVMWALAAAAAFVGARRLRYVYFSADVALAAMFFFYLGHRLAAEPARWWQGLLWAGSALAIWLLRHEYMEMATRRYPLFPLCYVAAVSGAYFAIWQTRQLFQPHGRQQHGSLWRALPGQPVEVRLGRRGHPRAPRRRGPVGGPAHRGGPGGDAVLDLSQERAGEAERRAGRRLTLSKRFRP